MKDVYEVLRQKELEQSRLENEVEALHVVAPLLSEDGEAENDNQLTLERAVNATPQPDHSGWQDKPKKRFWP
jgi:asparagine synthetase A